jgi:hypothetical protein
MRLTDIRLVAETGDHAFVMADDEHGNVVVCGHRLIRFRAGSLAPRAEECLDGLVGQFIENHVVTIVADEEEPSLLLPRGKRVRLPKTAAGGCYGTAYDRSVESLYLLTVNSLLEVSLRSLEVKTTPFENPPDAPHAHYENVIAKDGCAAAFSYGLGFWSPLGVFRHDERPYGKAAIVGPDRVMAAEDRGAIDVYDASGRLVETRDAPPGSIHALDTIQGTPWTAWVEHLGGELQIGERVTERTVRLGDTEIEVREVWFENRVGYAKLLGAEERAVFLGECSADTYAVIPEAHCVVFGTMDGTLVLWEPQTHAVETTMLPEHGSRRNPRIVSLLWCEPRQLLFLGTRDGGVYTARIEPRG